MAQVKPVGKWRAARGDLPEKDTAAMRQDWIEVGQYLRSAMDEVAAASANAPTTG